LPLAPSASVCWNPNRPVSDDNLFFIQGNVTDETLARANLAQAKTIVILGDDRLDAMTRDAKVVLNTLTAESINHFDCHCL
jgi:voltage-gated potassium channel